MIPADQLISLHRLGFKLVPLAKDGVTPAIPWTQIYENGGWQSESELQNMAFRFHSVATCFGPTQKRNEMGAPLFLNCLDIDSNEVFYILENLHDKTRGIRYSLIDEVKKHTYVTKTRKKFGYHIYWFSVNHNKPVRSEMCKEGYEFEIKCDKSGGLTTLPPSSHRADPEWHYTGVGAQEIVIYPLLYNVLKKLLFKECLKKQESKSDNNNNNNDAQQDGISEPAGQITLDDTGVAKLVDVLLEDYKAGARHTITMYLAGYLHKRFVSLDVARQVVTKLARAAGDEELRGRLYTVESTYKKQRVKVRGFEGLKNVLGKNTLEQLVNLTA